MVFVETCRQSRYPRQLANGSVRIISYDATFQKPAFPYNPSWERSIVPSTQRADSVPLSIMRLGGGSTTRAS